MKTVAIETSCDDTSIAIVNYKDWFFEVEKCLLYSQIDKHRQYGGVVPELASRLHEEKIVDLIKEIGLHNIKNSDFISYTCCPGLPWSLLVWKTAANTLSLFLEKEKLGVHHIDGHIFSIFANRSIHDVQLPLVVLTVSGGHNDMYIVNNEWWMINDKLDEYLEKFSKNYNLDKESLVRQVWPFTVYKVWFTLDDAAWEAFDKVSKMLNGPYPGGRWIYETSKKFRVNSEQWKNNLISEVYFQSFDNHQSFPQISKNIPISFPRIWLKKNEFNFSFSWLKAQVNYKIQDLKKEYWENLPEEIVSLVAYEFQQAVIETLWTKLLKASKFFWIENIALVGGVSANIALKDFIKSNMEKYNIKNFYTPVDNLYSTDNAAMIGVVGILERLRIKK